MDEVKNGVEGVGASGEKASGTQAKQKVKEATQQLQEKAGEATQQVGERAKEARGQAGAQLRKQVDTRATQAGEQVTSIAEALRRTGDQLRGEGKEGPAKLGDQAAERMERLGGYLRHSDADRILGDVESVARRQPWAFATGALLLGFVASRFLKASSSRRYQTVGGGGAEYPSRFGGSSEHAGYQSPQALPRGTAREPVGATSESEHSQPGKVTPAAPAVSGPGGSQEL
jgi:hypothetical protein